jgi:hypothetical protein
MKFGLFGVLFSENNNFSIPRQGASKGSTINITYYEIHSTTDSCNLISF